MDEDPCELSLCEIHIHISTVRMFTILSIDYMKNILYIWLNASERSCKVIN